MNRNLTNIIRFCMDECIPAIVRDNKCFMLPFYYFAYRGRNIKQVMNFKKLVYSFSEQEYAEFYTNLNTISRNRETDLNSGCLKLILEEVNNTDKNLVDIGCGNGYLLKKIHETHPAIDLFGFDIKNESRDTEYKFVQGNIERLPFADKSFDVVTCSHVMEHILDYTKAVNELKRITRKKLIIVTPCQRYFFYTLDEHVNFYPFAEKLTSVFNIEKNTCRKINGDWVYIADMS